MKKVLAEPILNGEFKIEPTILFLITLMRFLIFSYWVTSIKEG